MKEQFVTYEQALALKELGFDEPCFGVHYNEGLNPFVIVASQYGEQGATANGGVLAPLYQQAFRHFRERFKLSSHTDLLSISHSGENYYYQILNFADLISPETTFKVDGFETQEEAESACLDKLIQFLS